jgi:hypothetical protein
VSALPDGFVATQRDLIEAVGELSLAISPHYMDQRQRKRISEALHVLVNHIIAYKRSNDSEEG